MCHGRCPTGRGGLTRRSFVRRCGAALAAASALPAAARAAERRVRVGVIFLAKLKVSWPYPEFDAARREQEIVALLRDNCPGIEFIPLAVRGVADVAKATALKDQVDGFLVYCVTLSWELAPAIAAIGKLGKPLLVADEHLGGSGLFLTGFSGLRRGRVPAVGVATTRKDDLVAAARCFGDLAPGTTPEEFARRCDEVYRRTFARPKEGGVAEDRVSLEPIGRALERFTSSRFLIVGSGTPGKEQDFLGAKGIHVGFDELAELYEKVDPDEARAWAERWSRETEKIVEPTAEVLLKAARVYRATVALLQRHGTDSVTMNCLGGFKAGKLPAYPCLGFMQILNDGGDGVCEAMPDDTLSMLMARILTGRPGFVSDPVLDTAKNQIIYAHCVATTKVFGTGGPSNAFRIRTLHDRDPRGSCAQSLMPAGYLTTSFRTNWAARRMVIHQAKAAGNLESDRGCRTQLVGEVRGDIGKLFGEWDAFSWHRVTVYGDVKAPLAEFGRALGLSIVEEA